MTTTTDDPGTRGLPRWAPLAAGFVALVAIIALLGAVGGGDDEPIAGADEALFAFAFANADGTATTLEEFRGEPLVINYFAAWCAPCRAELPDFEAVHRDLADEVTFVGISRDTTTGAWQSLIADTGVTFPTVFEGNIEGSFAHVDARAMPTTVLVDADGVVQRVWSGSLDDDGLRDLIRDHLS